MTFKNARSGATPRLRIRAEAEIQQKKASTSKGEKPLTPEEAQRTIHELHVHQIELEMQNEELCRVQAELEAVRAHYFDLYHLAPIGYCILSRGGLVLEANLTAVNMLELALSTLVKKPITRFIYREDQDIYYQHLKQLYQANQPTSCELRMVKKDGIPFWVQLTSSPSDSVQGIAGEPANRLVMSDITERKRVQEENAKLKIQLEKARKQPAPGKKAGKA